MILRVFAAVLVVLASTGWVSAQTSDIVAAKPAEQPKAKAKAKPKAKPQPAKAAAKPTVPRAATPATGDAPDAKPETSTTSQTIKDSYAALSFSERLSIQSDLVWTGDYNGMINGELSDRLIAAVKAFQRRNKSKETGVLNLQERASLAASAKPLQAEVGWRLVEDQVSGARLGLPNKLATVASRGGFGTRWSSQQGQLQVETFRLPNTQLEAAYERQRREPVGRRPSYNILRTDFFVVSGMQGLKKFYVRASAQNNEVRGITILYDQAMEGTMDPVVVAMSSAFVPFATLGAMQEGVPSRRKVEYGTGLVVSGTGHVVTDKQIVDGCNVISVPGIGNAERLAEDTASDLALLRVYGARDLTPLGLRGDAPRGEALTLLGIADPQTQGGGVAISSVAAKLANGNPQALETTPAAGFSGAVAIDGQGRPYGVVVLKAALVAGPAQSPRAAIVPLERLNAFLEANDVAPPPAQPGADPKASVVRVICVRK